MSSGRLAINFCFSKPKKSIMHSRQEPLAASSTVRECGPIGRLSQQAQHVPTLASLALRTGKRTIMNRSWLSRGLQAVACIGTLVMTGGQGLSAQEAYPTRTVTIVVPYTAGGGV